MGGLHHPAVFVPLQGGVNVLTACGEVTSSLTAIEVALLTNAWAELLTPTSVNDNTVSCSHIAMVVSSVPCMFCNLKQCITWSLNRTDSPYAYCSLCIA